VHDRELSEDLTQEVFCRAWKALPAMPPGPLNMQPWLCRIATNLAIDTLRRQRLLAWSSLGQSEQEPQDERQADPQIVYTATEIISTAMARLPVSYRRALLLRAQGYRLTEIADRLGVARSGIKMHLSRARHAFQKHSTGCYKARSKSRHQGNRHQPGH